MAHLFFLIDVYSSNDCKYSNNEPKPFPQELIILKSLTKVKLYLSDLENWLKCSVIWTSIAISCAGLMRIHWHWLRCLNSLAILLAFIQTLFLFGKFPGRGLWVFIHFKVASRVLKVSHYLQWSLRRYI